MVGPDYHKPPAPLTASFKELPGWQIASPADTMDKGRWWEVYHDPLLDRLEAQVDAGNQTIREQVAAYDNAQALVDEARAALFPVLSVNAGDTRSSEGGGSIASGASGISSAAATTTGTTSTSAGTGTTTGTTTTGTTGAKTTTAQSGVSASRSFTRTTYTLEGIASWDLVVWGKIRRQVESNVAAAQASEALLANARLSEQGMLATDYLDLRVTDALQRVLNDTVANDTKSLQITQNQYTAGVAARSDVLTAQTQLEAAQSAAINVGVARAQYEHAIAVLIGVPPAAFSLAVVTSVPPVPDTPGIVPSLLLERRPDIAEAERTMKSENALIGVAVGAYYPDITLSGLFGYAGDPVNTLFSSATRVWSLGVSASDALFEGGSRSAAVRAARATYDQSVATYRQTVLTAFQQVEDALSGLRILQRQDVVERQTVVDAGRSAQIALNEYRAGTQPFTTVITAQNTLLTAQQTEISIEMSILTDSVALIQALGGGWRTADLPDRNWLQRRDPLLP